MHGLNAYLQSAELAELWSDEAVLAAMLRFELELARTQAAHATNGAVPEAHAHVMATVIREQFSDSAALHALANRVGAKARVAGTLVIPLVDELREQIVSRDAAAAKHVHLGATSQDVVDTAMMLQAQASLAWMDRQLNTLGDALAKHAQTHQQTPMMGRTLLQAAVPIPFGYKVAVWLSGVLRSRMALRALPCMLQLGGAAGTLHSIAAQKDLTAALAKRLGLQVPTITWHAQRDMVSRLGSELAILCGVLGKLGFDVALAMQNEVGELSEPHESGRGTSSAMAHKRNPVGAMHMVQAAERAPALAASLLQQQLAEHERALGSWQAQLFIVRDLFLLTGGALEAAVEVVRGLQVNAKQMGQNLHGQTLSDSAAAQNMIEHVLAQWQATKN